jgi:predicted nucleic acid-binding protein
MIDAIRDAASVYFDTAPLIYFVENNRTFSKLVEPAIRAIDSGEKTGFSSYITLLEVLVKPFEQGRLDLVEQYRRRLVGQPYFRLLAIEEAVAEEAARIRAAHGFGVADAIQLATALLSSADVFLTNDNRLAQFQRVRIVVLRDHVGDS